MKFLKEFLEYIRENNLDQWFKKNIDQKPSYGKTDPWASRSKAVGSDRGQYDKSKQKVASGGLSGEKQITFKDVETKYKSALDRFIDALENETNWHRGSGPVQLDPENWDWSTEDDGDGIPSLIARNEYWDDEAEFVFEPISGTWDVEAR